MYQLFNEYFTSIWKSMKNIVKKKVELQIKGRELYLPTLPFDTFMSPS